ncbi:MAG: hypothetical protein KGS72_00035 [Cyanobacteria bacterium REEB67]|nr:hypothetical protein [Cyanobacteria bacterium REEB67]
MNSPARLSRSLGAAAVLLSVGVSCCVLAKAPDKAGPTEGKVRCLRLQQSNMYFGDCTIYAADDALKIVFKSGKWMNICRGPKWELYVLNPGEKIYCHTALKDWKPARMNLAMLSKGGQGLAPTKRMAIIAGLRAAEYMPIESPGGDRYSGAKSVWVVADRTFPEAINTILAGNDFIANTHRLPLRVVFHTASIDKSVDTSAAGEVDMPRSFFDIPFGMRETKDPQEVMNSGIMDVVKDMAGF